MRTEFCVGLLCVAAGLGTGPLTAAESARPAPAARVRLAQIVQRAGPEQKAELLTFKGAVIDADSKPVAGVNVELYQGPENTITGADAPPVATANTAADGAFSLASPSGSILLVASRPGFAPTWLTLWRATESSTDLKLKLGKPEIISGSLSDAQGKPVPDADISISMALLDVELEEGARSISYLRGPRAPELFRTRSQADGSFVFTNVPPGMRADFTVQKPGLALRLPERPHISSETMVAVAGQTNVQLVLDSAGRVEGKVVSESGEGLAKAKVTVAATRPGVGLSSPPEMETAADGSFAMDSLAPGDYRLMVSFGTNEPAAWVAEYVTVTVEAGKTASEKIVAIKGGLLAATVLSSEDQKPVSKAMVNINSEKFRIARPTGPEGTVTLRLPAGEYNVLVSKDMSRGTSQQVTVAAGETAKAELTLNSPPRLAGKVTDASGKGVEGVQLRILPEWAGDLNLKTDAEGNYSGTWDRSRYGSMDRQFYLIARHSGLNLAAAEEISEDAKTLDLQLKPSLILTGRVENAQGKGLADASVTTYFWAGNMGSSLDRKPVRTDANGYYAITGLPQGAKYSVNATAKGYGSGSESLDADSTATDRVEVPTFSLEVADLKLAGKVVDSEDKPVSQAYVHIYGQKQPQASVRTGADGTFSFDAVCAGDIQVSANVPTGGGYGNARAQGGDTNVVIQVGSSGGYVSEELPKRVALKGKPLPDLAAAGLGTEKLPGQQPVLLCLFDAEQRPSRRVVRQLADQFDALKQKGVALAVLHVNPGGIESYKEWKTSATAGMATGCIEDKADAKLKWAMDMGTLPWLILADKEHKVLAEGFAIEELESKLQDLK